MFQDNKADVILKYNADEARSLKAYGELPEHGEFSERHGIVACCKTAYSNLFSSFSAKINETDTFGPGDDDEIQFDDIGDDDEDIDDVTTLNY